jgi:hypothetical protein
VDREDEEWVFEMRTIKAPCRECQRKPQPETHT